LIRFDFDYNLYKIKGRIYQIEYAMEAVKQGSATVGIKSKTHVVLVALKRASSELSAHQKKIVPIDDHLGISIAGLAADARILSRFMRNECLNNKYAFTAPMPVTRLVSLIGNSKRHLNTF
jgi:20S proteasome subunit alpha 6